MSDEPTGQAQRDLEGEFQAGRREALEAIAADLRDRRTIYAEVAVKDFFGFGLSPSDRRIITSVVAKPFLDHYRQYIVAAVKTFQAGHDVLSVLGQDQDNIKKYQAVTSGDYDAGAMSAAHDMKYLMLGITTDHVVDDFLKTLRNKPSLAAIFIKGAEKNSHSIEPSEGRPAPKYEETLKRFLDMMIVTKLDGDLCRIQQKFIQDVKLPHLVGYGGDAPAPMRFRFLHAAYNRMAEPMNVISILKGKVPNSWPPFHVEGTFNDTAPRGEAVEDKITRADVAAYERTLPVNENPEFQRGMKEALEHIYLQSQTRHFDVMNDGKGGYTAQLGISSYWNKLVTNLASQAYSDFRSDIRDLMYRPARGEGESYDDGVNMAYDLAQKYINALGIKGVNADQMEYERSMHKFKAFWGNELSLLKTK